MNLKAELSKIKQEELMDAQAFIKQQYELISVVEQTRLDGTRLRIVETRESEFPEINLIMRVLRIIEIYQQEYVASQLDMFGDLGVPIGKPVIRVQNSGAPTLFDLFEGEQS